MINEEFFKSDGEPIKCHSCLREEIKIKVHDTAAGGVTAEASYLCVNCNYTLGYYAYGYFNPAYYVGY